MLPVLRQAHARNGSCAIRILQVVGERSGGVRSFAAETGREGTSADELSGDPNRAPQKKGEGVRQDKEVNDDIKKGHQEEASDKEVDKAGREQQQDREDVGTPNIPNKK